MKSPLLPFVLPTPKHKSRLAPPVYLNPPTVAEVAEYLERMGWSGLVDARALVSKMDAVGWIYGRAQLPVRSWKALCASWARQAELARE